MGNHRGGVGHSNGGGNNRGGVDGVGNNRGSMNGVGNDGGRVDGVGNRDSLRVLGLASVRDLSDVAVNVVGVVGDGLDTAVRKVHLVGALNNTGAIVALGLAEGSARVLVSNSVVVGVGGDLGKVGGSVSNSMGNGGSVDNRSVVDNGGMVDDRSGMDHRSSVAKTMSNNTVGKSVANNAVGKTVSNDSVGETVSGNNSVSKTVAGKELRGSRGRSKEGGDASKGLKKKNVPLSIS